MDNKKYIASKGSQFSGKDAQKYGRCLDKIAGKNNGNITPEIVVNHARKPNSPLHGYFDWDLESAAKKHWIERARHLINHIEIVVSNIPVHRAFINVVTKDYGRVYRNTIEVMNDDELRHQAIQRAMNYFNEGKRRYDNLLELNEIFTAIDVVRKKVA